MRLPKLKRIFENVAALGRPLYYPSIKIEGRRTLSGVEIIGTADVPDGTILLYEVGPSGLVGLVTGRRRGSARVLDEHYEIRFEPAPWKAASLSVTIILRGDATQRPEAQKKLGRDGERMASDIGGDGHSDWFSTAIVEI